MGDAGKTELLRGHVTINQPESGGYRAGMDAVLLAAATLVKSGERVCDFGCGVGAIGLCLLARVQSLSVLGVDSYGPYIDLARENVVLNKATTQMTVKRADVATLPSTLSGERFDHVVMNPPFYKAGTVNAPRDSGRRSAHIEDQSGLAPWLVSAAALLKDRGYLTMIHHISRLEDVLRELPVLMGSLELRLIYPRSGESAIRFILRARRGGRSALITHPPLILHQDGGNTYTPAVKRILEAPISLEDALHDETFGRMETA